MATAVRNVVIILGPPGAGKGTQARAVESELSLPQISTGDMLRDAIARKTSLGLEARRAMDAGGLVSDDIVNGILGARIQAGDCDHGFILDGYPRNLSQAEALNQYLGDGDRVSVIELDVNMRRLVSRLTARRTCSKCSEIYNLESRPPKRQGVCDKCRGELVQRPDDTEQVVMDRMETYRAQTEPLVAFYRGEGNYAKVDGMAPIEDVTGTLISIIRSGCRISA